MNTPSAAEPFGPYMIRDVVAEGALARTCRATHTETRDSVLLHILNPLAARNEQIAALMKSLRDPQSERRIVHPAVLRITDVGQVGDALYVACEEFDGVPLNAFLAEEPLTLRQKLHLAIALTEALAAVHAHRVVVGELKPQSILVRCTRENRLVVKIALTDLATVAGEATISIYGALLGAPKYMPPEQILGKRLTPPSDLFALGVILYEMFTGREPFRSETATGYLQSNLHSEPQPPTAIESTLPADMNRVLLRLLEKDARNRYRRASSLLEDLERLETRLEGGACEAAPPGADSAFAVPVNVDGESAGPWRGIAIACLVVIVLLLGVIAWALLKPAQPVPGPTGEAAPTAALREDRAPSSASVPQPDTGTVEAPVAAPGAVVAAATPRTPSASAPAAPAPEKTDVLETLLTEAEALAKDGRFDEALTRLNDAKTRYADAVSQALVDDLQMRIRISQAEAQARNGNEAEALTALQRLAEERPGSAAGKRAAERAAEILRRQAETAQARGDAGAAVIALERIVKEFPDTSVAGIARNDLPRLRARQGEALLPTDSDKAVSDLRAALVGAGERDLPGIRRQLAAALVYRAGVYSRTSRFGDALKDLKEAILLDPTQRTSVRVLEPEALYGQAMALKAQGDIAGALAVWQVLQKDYPVSPWLAKGMKEMSDLSTKAGPETGDNATILLGMARKEMDSGSPEKGRKLLQEVVAKYPASQAGSEALSILSEGDLAEAMSLWQSGQWDEAAPRLEHIVKTYAGTPSAREAERELRRRAATPKGMCFVPGGEFIQGLDATQVKDVLRQFNVPSDTVLSREVTAQRWGKPVRVGSFHLDRCEVTNAEYKSFVDATGAPPPPQCPAWDGASVREGCENLPVTNVTWAEAAAYAKWAGKRLPTEAEWERAARAHDGRYFVWGNRFDPSKAVIGVDRPRPVGSAAADASPYGVMDLVGNVQEWTQDEFAPYPASPGEAPKPSGGQRAVRGGCWHESDGFSVLGTARIGVSPDTRSTTLGFRCAKDAAE